MLKKTMIYKKYYLNSKLQKSVISYSNFTYYPITRLINRLLKTDMTVLDLGCGVGTIDFFMASRCKHVTGIDFSEKAILNADKSKNLMGFKNITFSCKDVANFHTIKDFDFILCSEILEHIKDDQYFLKNISSFLKHDGKMLLTTTLNTAPLCKFGLTKGFDERVGHVRRYDLELLKKLILKSRSKIINISYGEGIFRNSLFVFRFLDPVIRMGNKYPLMSTFLSSIDNISIKLLGPSNIYLTITKE